MDRSRLIDDLDVLALRVSRLSVSRHDPERFFVERSDIVDGLRRLIAGLQGGKPVGFREGREAKASPDFLPPCESAKDFKRVGGKGE